MRIQWAPGARLGIKQLPETLLQLTFTDYAETLRQAAASISAGEAWGQ